MHLAAYLLPWFAQWNRAVLQWLFYVLPHTPLRIHTAQLLVGNPLLSTWIFALAFYLFWRIEDERTAWRRSRLMEVIVACGVIVFLTLLVRPWMGWPPPARSGVFRKMYPPELWGLGSKNSFPSHSALVYMVVALGFWPLRRRLSVLLAIFVLLAISLPRIYLGGHYPMDVVVSVVLAAITMPLIHLACARPAISERLRQLSTAGVAVEFALFFWLFELGEGFQASSRIFFLLLRATKFALGRQ